MARKKRPNEVSPPVPETASFGLDKLSKKERRLQERLAHAGPKRKQKIKRFTIQETQAQMQEIADGWIAGDDERTIRAKMAKKGIATSHARFYTLKARVQEEAKLEHERDKPLSKQRQLKRLYKLRQQAEGLRTVDGRGWIIKPVHTALVRYEELIAKIEGNFEPLKIDVDIVHREAIMQVLGNMTDAHAQALVESYDRMASLAAHAAKERGEAMPLLLPPITTENAAE